MKDKDIKKLLDENKKVIIPGLGMFMTSEYSGKHTIMFNPYLQINDGILSKHLVDEYQISQEEALNGIESYVAGIKAKTSNGSVIIQGVGELSSKGDGALNFVQQEDKSGLSESQTIDTDKPEESPATATIQQVEIKAEVQEIHSVESKDELIVEEKKESISLKFELPKPTEIKSEKKESIAQQPDKKEDVEQEKSDIEALKKGAEKLAKEPKRRNKKRLILIVFLLVVIGGGATLVYLNLDEVKLWISEMTGGLTEEKPESEPNAAETELLTQAEEDSTAPEEDYTEEEQEENPIQTEEEVAPIETPVAKSQGATNQYHVIAGSFSVEENAINLVVQLTQKGYNAQLLGKFGSLYQVSAGASADKQAANDIAKKLKEAENMDSWIRLW
jgi:cell division septation protein DedD